MPSGVDALHRDLWQRFVAMPQGLLLDYTLHGDSGNLPTPEEARLGQPNALSWWTPVENSAFYSGLYLDGMVRRWKMTQAADDREKAAKLARGLLLCAPEGAAPGFIARSVLADEKSHYGIGSDDQTAPWFFGLWRYVQSGIPAPSERVVIVSKMVAVAEALQKANWSMPCDPLGDLKPGQFRGRWMSQDYRSAARLLFVTGIMAELTGESRWQDAYNAALEQKMPNGKSRLEVVAEGMPGEWREFPKLATDHLYIYVVSQAMVGELLHLEKRSEVIAQYSASLDACAQVCMERIQADPSLLGSQSYRTDWRKMNDLWRPQPMVGDATKLAMEQLGYWANKGRETEFKALREPFAAAWIAFLAPGKVTPQVREQFSKTLGSIPWEKVESSSGFFGECAWYVANDGCADRR